MLPFDDASDKAIAPWNSARTVSTSADPTFEVCRRFVKKSAWQPRHRRSALETDSFGLDTDTNDPDRFLIACGDDGFYAAPMPGKKVEGHLL